MENINEKNKHDRDDDITFQEDGHKYFIKGMDHDKIISVTSLLKKFEDGDFFDVAVMAIIRSQKWWNDDSYDYYSRSQDEIVDIMKSKGEEKIQAGTLLHDKIDKYFNGVREDNSKIPEWKYFLDFMHDHKHLEPLRSEWRIFHRRLHIAGTIDKLFLDRRSKTCVIADWKRVQKKITPRVSPSTKHLLDPISNVPDTSFFRYSLQLNLYRYILSTEYNLHVSEMFLIQLHPNFKTYIKVPCPVMDDEILKIVRDRTIEIENYM